MDYTFITCYACLWVKTDELWAIIILRNSSLDTQLFMLVVYGCSESIQTSSLIARAQQHSPRFTRDVIMSRLSLGFEVIKETWVIRPSIVWKACLFRQGTTLSGLMARMGTERCKIVVICRVSYSCCQPSVWDVTGCANVLQPFYAGNGREAFYSNPYAPLKCRAMTSILKRFRHCLH